MGNIDLNLLVALDALLAERSVTRAARRLGLSVSAMSRTLTRLRELTGDRLLLQAGRALVLTPHAESLSARIPALAREAQSALRPPDYRFDSATLAQTFSIRAGEGAVDLLAVPLLARLRATAPQVQLCFVPKPDWDAQPLREGTVDLEIGIVRTSAPELRTRVLLRDRYVGVCRRGHPAFARPAIALEDYAGCEHVRAARAGEGMHPVDIALEARACRRALKMVVPSYTAVLQVVRSSDLLGVVPHSCLGNSFMPGHAADMGVAHFELPVSLAPFKVAAIWHPRLDQDPAQRWFRDEVLAVCQAAYP